MSRYAMCPVCGHRLRRVYDDPDCDIYDAVYHCDYCDSNSDDDSSDERMSVYDAALAWASSGKDEDRMFGYSEDELEAALNS